MSEILKDNGEMMSPWPKEIFVIAIQVEDVDAGGHIWEIAKN